MNKKDVAERLGVSIRLVEKYAGEGRLGEITYVRGRTGKQADYSEEAVERLKHELESPDRQLPATYSPDARLFGALLERLAPTPEQTRSEPLRASDKILLTVKECRQLTGLSEAFLRQAIHSRELKGRILGRGYKVKRTDLDRYVGKL